ncbi:MAG TPA: CcoQ/FixQ family Cbb3-type cytochrome c oxidase assembly chaperone [Candidatus Limnocylindrales bacterium]|nr:CcoQ/FixQ family Cbb3-type cytochrome c oxidase assembly chaperone [Candidatus Limnocylindrales bacterium]
MPIAGWIDEGVIRGIGTVLLLLSFVALCVWAWAPAQRRRFEDASMLPFVDVGDANFRPDAARKEAR